MKLTIKNKEGESLVGDLEGTLTTKLVIICHGLADTKDNPTFVRLAEELKPSFRFDFSGNGGSEGNFEESTYHKQVADLHAVIGHFKNGGVKEFCLVGHSMGGGVVQVVAQDPVVKALVSLAGVNEAESFANKFPELVKEVQDKGKSCFFGKEEYPLTQEYIDSANTIDILSAAPNVHATVLCVQGSEDNLIRKQNTKEWLENLPQDTNSMFVELPGMGHDFGRRSTTAAECLQLLVDVVVPWANTNF